MKRNKKSSATKRVRILRRPLGSSGTARFPSILMSTFWRRPGAREAAGRGSRSWARRRGGGSESLLMIGGRRQTERLEPSFCLVRKRRVHRCDCDQMEDLAANHEVLTADLMSARI
jgi:hypothetical protein